MKNLKLAGKVFILVVITLISQTGFSQIIETNWHISTPRPYSPMTTLSQKIGISTVTLKYSRPRITDQRFGRNNDRTGKVWGRLVPFATDKRANIWRAGANENTVISFSDNVTIEGKPLKAGTYGLHMQLFKDGKASIIFSKNSTSWGSFFYKKDEDALRVDVQTKDVDYKREALSYDFMNFTANSAELTLHWEKKQIPFKIAFDVHNLVVANFKKELRSSAGYKWRGWYGAAKYCFQNNIENEQAVKWLDRSVRIEPRFENYILKAQLLAKMDKKDEAAKAQKLAMENGKMREILMHGLTSMMQRNDYKTADEMITFTEGKFKKTWQVPYVRGRYYQAKKEVKKAKKQYEKALKFADTPRAKSILQGSLKRLATSK